jgi:hypothetical protein
MAGLTPPQCSYGRRGHRNGEEFHGGIIVQQRSEPLVSLCYVFLGQQRVLAAGESFEMRNLNAGFSVAGILTMSH